jgi:hypothetical protein
MQQSQPPAVNEQGATTPLQQQSPSIQQAAIPSRKEDIDNHRQHQNDVKSILTALTNHAVQSDQRNQAHNEMMGQMLNHVAQGNHALGKHLELANQIALAPVEAVRDKMGKITGKRVVLPQQQV